MIVTLTPPECRLAAQAGIERRLGALHAQTHAVYGAPAAGELWDIDVEAAAAELAVAKAAGAYWAPAATAAEDKRIGDLPGGIQVRWTRRPAGQLIVHPRDDDSHTFVLVVGSMPELRIAGWMPATEAKVPDFWWAQAPRPAFFVPQDRLRPFTPEALRR